MLVAEFINCDDWELNEEQMTQEDIVHAVVPKTGSKSRTTALKTLNMNSTSIIMPRLLL